MSIKEKGYDVYDREIPPENTPYPFVYLDDFQQVDEGLKDFSVGKVYPTIHIYGLISKRGSVSKVALGIKEICHELRRTDNFAWRCKGNMSANFSKDYEGSTPLIHCILEPTFDFS